MEMFVTLPRKYHTNQTVHRGCGLQYSFESTEIPGKPVLLMVHMVIFVLVHGNNPKHISYSFEKANCFKGSTIKPILLNVGGLGYLPGVSASPCNVGRTSSECQSTSVKRDIFCCVYNGITSGKSQISTLSNCTLSVQVQSCQPINGDEICHINLENWWLEMKLKVQSELSLHQHHHKIRTFCRQS